MFHVVYFVLLSLLACSFNNNIAHAAAEGKSDNGVGDGGGNWLRGAAWFPTIGGSIGGGIPGLGIGGSVGGGITGGAIPGIGIGGGMSGFGTGGIGGVTVSGTNEANSAHSIGTGGGSGTAAGWVMAPEWLGQRLYCTPMRCQGSACGGVELQLGSPFISPHDDHQQPPAQVSSAEAPWSG